MEKEKIEVREEGCGRCKHYVHLRSPTSRGGLCKNPDSPHRGYVGVYGELIEYCDMMEVDE